MIRAFYRAVSQLNDPALKRPLIFGLLIALFVFFALWGGAAWVLFRTQISEIGWLDSLMDFAGGLAALVLAILFFPGTVTAASTLFLDGAVDAVERRFYPGLPEPRRVPLSESVRQGMRLLGLALTLNLVCLPLYFVPVVNTVVFALVNGVLIGREYFELVAARRLDASAVDGMRSRKFAVLTLTGAGFALLTLVPLVNLFVPVLAAATLTHLFHSWSSASIFVGSR